MKEIKTMMNKKIKMVALNDEALEDVVGGAIDKKQVKDFKHAVKEADDIFHFIDSIINFFF